MQQDFFGSMLAAEGVTGAEAALARSIYQQESGSGKNTKTSNQNAHGHMQIIPGTFKSVADKGWDINNPEHNIRAGIRYIKQLSKQAGGDPYLTAAGYYGGPGGMMKAKRGEAAYDSKNPDAPNTLQYAWETARRANLSSPLMSAEAPTSNRSKYKIRGGATQPSFAQAPPEGVAMQNIQANHQEQPVVPSLFDAIRERAATEPPKPITEVKWGEPKQTPVEPVEAAPTASQSFSASMEANANRAAQFSREMMARAQEQAQASYGKPWSASPNKWGRV